MNDSHASLLPLFGSGPGGSLRGVDFLASSFLFRLPSLLLRLSSSAASASAFACASACCVWSATSSMNIDSISSMLKSITSGFGPSTISTLPDDANIDETGDLGDTGDVGMYAVSGFSLLVILTHCSSIMSGSVARSSLSMASRRNLALVVSISR